MTRKELSQLKEVLSLLVSGVRFQEGRAVLALSCIINKAEAEHAVEDAHHDAAEADAYPVNAEAA